MTDTQHCGECERTFRSVRAYRIHVGKVHGPTTYPCSVEGCSRTQHNVGLCSTHLARLRRSGDLAADVPPETPGRSGAGYDPTAPVSYRTAHRRTEKTRGKASRHTCPCGAPAEEWALVHGTAPELVQEGYEGASQTGAWLRWSGDPNAYEPMCRHCHRQHDAAHRRAAAA